MSRDVNRELLELVAFTPEEIDAFYPDWIKAAKLFKLTDDVIENAVDYWIPTHWEIKYLGVRKMIGAYFRELVEISKSREYKANGAKVVYGIPPSIGNYYYAAKLAGGDKVFVGYPDAMLCHILNGYFHNAAPFFDRAEDNGFNYGCRHCPLNKMRYAAYTEKCIAAPDIIWSWGFNCDEGPKTDEFIQRMTSKDWNFHISRVPHDTRFDEDEEFVEHRLKFMSDQLKLGVKKIEEACDIKITDEIMAKANADYGRITFKIGMLSSIAFKANPLVLGGDTIAMLQRVSGYPFNSGLSYMEDAIDTLTKELKEAVKKGEGIMPKDTPTVAFYDQPLVLPWISRIFKENGVLPLFAMAMTLTQNQMAPSRYPDDPWMYAAELWSRYGINMNLNGEVKCTVEKIKTIKPDGLVLGFYDFDRWMGAHHKMLTKLVNEQVDTPVYYIEGDVWDDREYSEEAMKTRIESVCQIITNRKAALG